MNDLSFVQILLNASLLVQIVMVILLVISLISWSLILFKSRQFKRVERNCRDFEERFRKAKDLRELNNLYNRLSNNDDENPTGLEGLFSRGYEESRRLRKHLGSNPLGFLDGVARAMQVVLQREQARLDEGLATLATVGSVSPYIGLFGTVWGIMNSFHALGGVQQVTLAMVAPGISEALIATAMGLFTAIPAVVAYNLYTDSLDRLMGRYENLSDEFLGILQRQAIVPTPAVNPNPNSPLVPALNTAL